MANFRAARPQDLTAILQLWARSRSEHATTTDQAPDVERLITEAPGSLLVAESDGEIVGALIAAWDGWRGNMYRLAVSADHRRRGIALELVQAGEDYLRGKGARRITALVAYDDDTAGTFWERAGYPRDRIIGRRVRNL
jgi:ribosomal protein S18 acetylase RimI-like enzyme